MTANGRRGDLHRMRGRIKAVIGWSTFALASVGTAACVASLLTGGADHASEMSYGLTPPTPDRGPPDKSTWDEGPVLPWRFMKTPKGRHAAISLTRGGHMAMMIDLDGDRRYFALILQQKACAGSGGELRGAMLETMESGDYHRHGIRPDMGPWSRRQIAAECRRNNGAGHVYATRTAVMEWFMRVLPGEQFRLRTLGERRPEPSATELVTGPMNGVDMAAGAAE